MIWFRRAAALLVATTIAIVPPPVYAGWKTALFGAVVVGGVAGVAAMAARRALCNPNKPPEAVSGFVTELPAILGLADINRTLYDYHERKQRPESTDTPSGRGAWITPKAKGAEYREYNETPWGLGYLIWEDKRHQVLVIALRGTALTLPYPKDFLVDLWQWIGVHTDYYDEVLVLIAQRTSMKQFAGYTVVLTGHSLGGGMATYAGLVYGYRTVAFNAARLAEPTIQHAVLQNENIFRNSGERSSLAYRLQHNPKGFEEITQIRNYFDPVSSSIAPQYHTVNIGMKFIFSDIEGLNTHGINNLWLQIGNEDQVMSTLDSNVKKYKRACDLYYGGHPAI